MCRTQLACWAKMVSIALLALVSHQVHALDAAEWLEVHGYGNLGYLRTTDNTYLDADSSGTLENNTLAIVFTATINEKSKAWVQLHGNSRRVLLDWAYIDYQVSNQLTARVGQIKSPVGLYNEIRDIEFLKLSILNPALYSEAAEITHEAYRGGALAFEQEFGGGDLTWDAYAGQTFDPDGPDTLKNRLLVGGRVSYKTPVKGLLFMVSAYTSTQKNTHEGNRGKVNAGVLSASYTQNYWDLKAEYARLNNRLEGKQSRTYYVQAGRTFAEKWTPYARYDYITTDKAKAADPSFYQKTLSLGLDYKINHSIGLRIENHWNRGYALPVASHLRGTTNSEVAAGAGIKDWRLFAVSINFIF